MINVVMYVKVVKIKEKHENIAHKFSFGNYCSKHYTTQYKKSLRKPCCAITKSGKPCCKYVNEKIENNTKFFVLFMQKWV